MLKRNFITLAAFSLFLSYFSFSQDTLFLRNGETVLVSVVKVYEDFVKLKKLNEFDSPIYVYSNDEISLIKYQNGIIEYFDFRKKPANAPKHSYFPKITYFDNKFFLGSNLEQGITFQEAIMYTRDLSNERKLVDLNSLASQMEKNNQRQKVFFVLGIIPMGIGLASAGLGLIWYDRVTNLSPTFYKFGGIVFGFGAGMEIISIANGINKRKNSKRAIEAYNRYLGY